jgi:uncharacterized protein (DUF1015 family)
MGAHEQTDSPGCFSVDEYERGLIKKHEKTRKDKEDDRTATSSSCARRQASCFLVSRVTGDRRSPRKAVARTRSTTSPRSDVAHTVWRVTGADADALVGAFATLPALYIADGHHRAAPARVGESRSRRRSGRFIAVAFPDDHVQILPNRTVKDLGGKSPHEFISALAAKLPLAAAPVPTRAGDVSIIGGRWHTITLRPPQASRADALDVEQLQQQVLGRCLASAIRAPTSASTSAAAYGARPSSSVCHERAWLSRSRCVRSRSTT